MRRWISFPEQKEPKSFSDIRPYNSTFYGELFSMRDIAEILKKMDSVVL
jgi:hypothetical protein